jgi:hypothetical protein
MLRFIMPDHCRWTRYCRYFHTTLLLLGIIINNMSFRGGAKRRKMWLGTRHGERGSASLIEGLGALPPMGSRGKAPGQGVWGIRSPEADENLTASM